MLAGLMLDRSDWEVLSGVPVFWPDAEDAALDAIITLDTIWKARHRGYRWRLDKWGEGPSLLSFADLGLRVGTVTRVLSAVCPLHGRFRLTWTGFTLRERPKKVACPGRRGVACKMTYPVDYVREVTPD